MQAINTQLYTSTIETAIERNSYHIHVYLNIPENILLAKSISPIDTSDTSLPRILNPILPQNLQKFNNSFLEKNTMHIDHLTILLQNDNLDDLQWKEA
jgi:hypothetical protein